MKIRLYNKIAEVGTKRFPVAYEVSDSVADPDGILVRSARLHDLDLSPSLKAIARAGAGVNNIPVESCTEKGIVVFNTPGANANGVKEIVICALMLASRKIMQGADWVNTLQSDVAAEVEKEKSRFAGTEIMGKTLGVIGLGAVGGMVANTAVHLGMNVIGYDPYLSVDAAWVLSHHVKHAASYEEIYRDSDYITLHVPATPQTAEMICGETIAMMKDGVRIINFSRADLVNTEDLKEALASGKVSSYVTDFPTDEIVRTEGVVAIPHLGASTEEAEDNCAVMAVDEMTDFLENGNIRNSVNFPTVSMQRSGNTRICVLNENIPDVISGITSVLSSEGANIENMTNKSRNAVAYTMVDISGDIADGTVSEIEAIKGVIRVRVIH